MFLFYLALAVDVRGLRARHDVKRPSFEVHDPLADPERLLQRRYFYFPLRLQLTFEAFERLEDPKRGL